MLINGNLAHLHNPTMVEVVAASISALVWLLTAASRSSCCKAVWTADRRAAVLLFSSSSTETLDCRRVTCREEGRGESGVTEWLVERQRDRQKSGLLSSSSTDTLDCKQVSLRGRTETQSIQSQ